MLPTDETATEVALDLLTILGYAAILSLDHKSRRQHREV